jgi:hypothetical protein
MDRDEFSGLPLRLALGVIFDLLPGIASVEAPKSPFPPKYDDRMPKKGGQFCYMSEMTAEDLAWWYEKTQKSANAGGQYAEKDAKLASKISHWVKWRSVFPGALWSGERNRVKVTAAPPSREPKLHSWEDSKRNDSTASAPVDDGYGAAPSGGNEYSDADYGGSSDDSIPF